MLRTFVELKSRYRGETDYIVTFSDEPRNEHRITFVEEGRLFKKPLWGPEERAGLAIEAVREWMIEDHKRQIEWFKRKGFDIPDRLRENPKDYKIQGGK
ncbi:MAG: hypothetical protein PHS46_08655 [Candidatus Omnitrophica bacterium]|nr:hypothetical protein [Candidatus Omnitrophota bacterium]